MSSLKPLVKLIVLNQASILDQLHLEEFLLRDMQDNYCIVNYGSEPAIVMGISGKPHELIEIEQAQEQNIPVIKRFSGGGTVVIDENTIFATFIFNSEDIQVPCFPEPIYHFSEKIYKKTFYQLPFALLQNDYVMNDRKFGGNAQYIKKNRWLHHTSFLYDYKVSLMNLLKHPKKTPLYRLNRNHEDFICTLKSVHFSYDMFLENLTKSMSQFFDIEQIQSPIHISPSRSSTKRLDLISNV